MKKILVCLVVGTLMIFGLTMNKAQAVPVPVTIDGGYLGDVVDYVDLLFFRSTDNF